MGNMETFTPLSAIAYAIFNSMENLRFDKEDYFQVLDFSGLFYKRNRKHFLPCSHTFLVLAVQWLAHVPFTSMTWVRYLLRAVIRLKFHLGRMWEECFQFDSTKHRRFSPGTPISSCTNTSPMQWGMALTRLLRRIV